jgi:hypothetical protein
MINLIVSFVLGIVLGVQHRRMLDNLQKQVNELKKPQAEPVVTMGSYAPKPSNVFNQPGSRVVNPKTPQMLEAEAERKLIELNQTYPR